eukprot:6437495-Alexandrium_andersonii.AAC.1
MHAEVQLAVGCCTRTYQRAVPGAEATCALKPLRCCPRGVRLAMATAVAREHATARGATVNPV